MQLHDSSSKSLAATSNIFNKIGIFKVVLCTCFILLNERNQHILFPEMILNPFKEFPLNLQVMLFDVLTHN